MRALGILIFLLFFNFSWVAHADVSDCQSVVWKSHEIPALAQAFQYLREPEVWAIVQHRNRMLFEPDGSAQDKQEAVFVLGGLQDVRAVHLLLEALRRGDPDLDEWRFTERVLAQAIPLPTLIPMLVPVAENPADLAYLHAAAVLGRILKKMDPADPWYPILSPYEPMVLAISLNSLAYLPKPPPPSPLSETFRTYILKTDSPGLLRQITSSNAAEQLQLAMYFELWRRVQNTDPSFLFERIIQAEGVFEKLLAIHLLMGRPLTGDMLRFLLKEVIPNLQLPWVVRCFAITSVLEAIPSLSMPAEARAKMLGSMMPTGGEARLQANLRRLALSIPPEEQVSMGRFWYFLGRAE